MTDLPLILVIIGDLLGKGKTIWLRKGWSIDELKLIHEKDVLTSVLVTTLTDNRGSFSTTVLDAAMIDQWDLERVEDGWMLVLPKIPEQGASGIRVYSCVRK